MKSLITTILFAFFMLFTMNANAQLLIDDFTTGELEKVTIVEGSPQKYLQSGSRIIKGDNQTTGHRQVISKLNQNPFGHNGRLTIKNDLLVISFSYDTRGTVYLKYGVGKNGNVPMNLDVRKYKAIKIEFQAKSTINGVNLTIFGGGTHAGYSKNVRAREGVFVLTIPFSEIKPSENGFTFSDIDHMVFQFDSRSKTGCNMAINKIWFE